MAKFDKLISRIPNEYQPTVNKVWRAILEAIGTGDDNIEELIDNIKDQLFVETASGEFLDRLGSNVGVERPSSVGMSDTDFRELVPALSFAPKQVREVIWDLLEVFYKAASVFANISTTVPAPYNLTDGDTITFIVDGDSEIKVTFNASDFTDISVATALEVANAINKQSAGTNLVAAEQFNGITGERFVRARTQTPGPTGSIQIAGGTAQNSLLFPEVRSVAQDVGTTWDIDLVTGDTVRMEYTGVGSSPLFSELRTGDLMIISGPFDSDNQGSFILTDVVTGAAVDGITPGQKFTGNYVEFQNVIAVAETVAQTAQLDVAWYVPTVFDVTSLPRPAIMYEINHKEIVVILPASATIIGRNLEGSAHLHPNTENRTALITNSVGLSIRQGDTLIGSDAMYLSTGSGNYQRGDILTGGFSGATALVTEVINNDIDNTILAVQGVVGSFTGGETVTGSISGATRNFTTLISTINGTVDVDAILELDRKMAWKNLSGSFQAGEALLGRFAFKMEYINDSFEEGESITTSNAMHLIAPHVGDFLVGETITGNDSGATATVDAIVRNKVVGPLDQDVTSLEISSIVGGFIPGELVTGGVSLAYAVLDEIVLASGATTTIKSIDYHSAFGSIGTFNSITGVFNKREIVTGSSTGTKGVIGIVEISAAIFESTTIEEEFNSPYIFDEDAAFTVAGVASTINQNINPGSLLTTLNVNTLPEDWPNESGNFILEFGRGNEEGPIRYISKPNDNTLIVDPSFQYTKEHLSGAAINLIRSNTATLPNKDGSDYAVYITGLAEARTVLQEFIRQVVAAGIVVRFIVVFPEYRFSCFESNE